MESNPIQQRLEEFELKYLEVNEIEKYQYLVFRTSTEDVEMIDAFYEYMLGIDNEIEDVVILFQSPLYDEKTYSKDLVEELFSNTFIWNYSDKPDSIEENYIDWDMNMSLEKDKNVAALFVENINAFCDSVEFEEESNLVCILDYQNIKSKYILRWLKDLTSLKLHPKVRIVVSDTFENPVFNEFKNNEVSLTYVLEHHFNLIDAMKEIATMGDPEAPDTKYRFHLMQFYEAINKKQETDIIKQSDICLQIAKQHTEKDANWYPQIMFVYSTLASYEFSKKAYKEALKYIDKGIEAVKEVVGVLEDNITYRLLGQGYLFRGNLWLLIKKYKNAKADFLYGEECYRGCEDLIMQIEALRLIAVVARKDWDSELKNKALDTGVRLGVHFNTTLAESSTYTLLLKEVLDSNYYNYISDTELDQIVVPLFGEDWRTKCKSVKNIIFS